MKRVNLFKASLLATAAILTAPAAMAQETATPVAAPTAAPGIDPVGAPPLPMDASPAEEAAYKVLDKYCASCHQDGALENGLTKSKSGFGHVLDMRRLAQDPKFVTLGDHTKSKLYQVIAGGSPPMPDNCWSADCTPKAEELEVLKLWIDGLDDDVEEKKFVSLEELHRLAHEDLQKQPTNRRDRIRYISLRPLYNDSDVSPENYEAYRQATVKMINALSWNPEPYKWEAVDEYGVLMRIYLPEIDWDQHKWHTLEAIYPYGVGSETDPYLSPLKHMAKTEVPILRADWFAATASVSPLYYDLLGLPDTVQGLEQLLNLDMVKNIQNEQVVRAGFQDSGVSTNNRLIERHALGTGFFWTSYDFAGSKGRQSFFEYPLGPKEAYGEELAFNHDGGESIFTLPNGFHAYYLNTAEGERLDVGPTSIVRDDDYSDGTGEVVNGISCISCHSKGIRYNDDGVRDVAMGNLSLSPSSRQTIDAIYPGNDVVQDWFKKDQQAFFDTLTSAGIDPETTAGGLEPVRGLFVYYVDHFVDLQQAANELGMPEEELRKRMPFVGHQFASLMTRLEQSPIARDEWTAAYPVLLEKLTDYRPYVNDHKPVANLTHTVAAVVKDTPYEPPVKDDHSVYAPPPAKKHVPDTTYADVAKPDHKAYDPVAHSVPSQSHLTVYTDKPTYSVGEGLQVYIEPRHDCRLTLISIDDRHQSCVLYPFPGLDDIVIKGGSQYVFPPKGTLRTTHEGLETILAICNGGHDAIDLHTRDTSKVSCAADHKPLTKDQYETVVNEVLALDLGDDGGKDKHSPAGVDYRGVSDHNPKIVKSQISVVVTAH